MSGSKPDKKKLISGDDIEFLMSACAKAHVYNNFQCATTDAAILHGIIKVICEKKVHNVISQRTLRRMRYTIGDPYVVKPNMEENNGVIKAISAQQCRQRGNPYSAIIYIPWTEEEFEFHVDEASGSSSSIGGGGGYWSLVPFGVTRHVTTLQVPVALNSFLCHAADGSNVNATLGTECPLDPGGYFVVKGSEKVIVCPIIMQINHPQIRCDEKENGTYSLQYRSLSDHKKRSTSTLTLSLHAKKGASAPTMKVSVPFVGEPIPISMAMRLIGVEPSFVEMRKVILGETDDYARTALTSETLNMLDVCLNDCHVTSDMDVIVQQLVKLSCGTPASANAGEASRGRTVYNNFISEFLPNMSVPGSEDYLLRKQRMFGHLVFLLLQAYDGKLGRWQNLLMDRDDCSCKRIEHTGGEITYLFRRIWRPYIKSVLGASHNSMESGKKRHLSELTKTTALQSLIYYAFSTGNWGTEKAGSKQTGVSQQRCSLNYAAAMSHVDRVESQINKEGKVPKLRMLRSSQWGVMCPVETQEGESCGQTHNLTIQSRIRHGAIADDIRPLAVCAGGWVRRLTECSVDELRTRPLLMLNGAMEGIVDDVPALEAHLRECRRVGALPVDTSIGVAPGGSPGITVCADAGASVRPVLVISQLHKLAGITHRCRRYPHLLLGRLLATGVLQYMEKYEEMSSGVKVACSLSQLRRMGGDAGIDYTYMEVHPALLMGVSASLIPLSDHNQAPRNIHGSCMNKQSASRSTYVADQRNDTTALRLWYPQRPLVSTAPAYAVGANDLPSGQNAIVAIMAFNGNNQEDAIEMCSASLDCGMFRSYYERTHRDRDSGLGTGNRTKFQHISEKNRYYDAAGNPVSGAKDCNYTKLGRDGIADCGTYIQRGDCVFGKRESNVSDSSTKDVSTAYREREPTQVTAVRLVCGETNGKKCAIMKTLAQRRPQVGDKFSSRHGQKGVAGEMFSREDAPYTQDGITPDVIINPHGQPSRMTLGQQIEAVVSKLLCVNPASRRTTQYDGTAFRNDMNCVDGDEHIANIDKQMHSYGFQKLGHEILYSGITGMPLSSAYLYKYDSAVTGDNGTCIAPMYYQSLRHIAKEKIGVRRIGPYDPITMQPIDGRSREGGLRFGEMEKDAGICYGAAEMLRGRLFKDSDAFPVVYCTACNREAHFVASNGGSGGEKGSSAASSASVDQILTMNHQPGRGALGEETDGGRRMYCAACKSYKSCCLTYIPKGMHCAIHEAEAMMIGWRIHCASQDDNQVRLVSGGRPK